MGDHLWFWRMDFPPLIAILANITDFLGGDTPFGVSVMPALAGTALMLLAAVIAWQLGGGRFAQGLAMLAVLSTPLFLRASVLFQPVVLDQLWWTVALLGAVLLARTRNPRWWLMIGLACGVGLLTKFSILILALALLVGTLLTPLRSTLMTRWPWIGAGIALIIGSPSIVGQIRLGWPLLSQMSDLRQEQLSNVTTLSFLTEQLLYGPGAVMGLVGLVALLVARHFRWVRILAWVCLAGFAIVMGAQGKPYYIGPVYPALMAAGAIVLEGLPRWWGSTLRWGTVAAVIAFGLVALPFGLPILSPEETARYAAAAGVTSTVRTNTGEMALLPQDYGDMLYWEEKVASIARVYDSLPPDERSDAVILAGNYGQAGAVDFYGERYGLPQAVAPLGSYWFFGPGEKPGRVLITIGVSREDLEESYGEVRTAKTLHYPMAVEEEQDLEILISRFPRMTLQEVWPQFAGQH